MNQVRTKIHYSLIDPMPYTGLNIGIAFLDTGISPHIDFIKPYNRILAFKDFLHNKEIPYDDHGHGTHICGIASGNGLVSNGLYAGIAPKSLIIVGKILDHNGNGDIDTIEQAIQWIINNKSKYRIKILNISIGTTLLLSAKNAKRLISAVESAWQADICVVVAAGNNGPGLKTITAPGSSHKVITVGAYDDYLCIDYKNQKYIHYSGRGSTKSQLYKPDLIAPGTNITSCSNLYSKNTFASYCIRSGTSMSTAVVSGSLALFFEQNPSLSNNQTKKILLNSCNDLNLSRNYQGNGLLNVSNFLSLI